MKYTPELDKSPTYLRMTNINKKGSDSFPKILENTK